MTITHALARSFIAPIFVGGGVDAVAHPETKAVAAQKVTDQLAEFGLPSDPTRLVRVNGAVQLVAGTLLVLGRLPRLASAALAASMVPTTLAGHRFWEETDSTAKAQQRVQFMKNLAVLGGLLLAATDRNGAPSLSWRAHRAARRTSASIDSIRSSASDHFSHDSTLADRAGALGERVVKATGPLVERAVELAGNVGEVVSDRAATVARSMRS